MKVEFGFQANCSEIITYLGASTREEVVAAMGKLQEATGWTWRITESIKYTGEDKKDNWWNYYVLVPVEKLEELLILEENPPGFVKYLFGIWPDSLIPLWENKLPPEVKERLNVDRSLFLNYGAFLGNYLCLANIPEQISVKVEDPRRDPGLQLTEEIISLDWSSVNHLPRELNYSADANWGDFYGIRMLSEIFDSSVGGFGGTSENYSKWLKEADESYQWWLKEKTSWRGK